MRKNNAVMLHFEGWETDGGELQRKRSVRRSRVDKNEEKNSVFSALDSCRNSATRLHGTSDVPTSYRLQSSNEKRMLRSCVHRLYFSPCVRNTTDVRRHPLRSKKRIRNLRETITLEPVTYAKGSNTLETNTLPGKNELGQNVLGSDSTA